MRLIGTGLLLAGTAAFAMILAPGLTMAQQGSDLGVDETRVIIPRPKVIRVPEQNAQTGDQTIQQAESSQQGTADDQTSTIETRPLEPLSGSSTGGGVIPIEDQVALTDPTVGVAQPLPFPADPSDTPRVRVLRPSAAAGDGDAQQDGGSESDTAAVTPEDQSKPRWQRKRNRRFKLAPKGTEILDTTRPAYAVPIAPIETDLKGGARLRQLDKMTGQTVTYDLSIGETRRVDRLQVTLDACRSPDGNTSRGAMAFLKIWDTRRLESDPSFTGWMFAESPALSALDHPRYDLWVISCTTSAAEVSTVSE